jgi:hypothetical protein
MLAQAVMASQGTNTLAYFGRNVIVSDEGEKKFCNVVDLAKFFSEILCLDKNFILPEILNSRWITCFSALFNKLGHSCYLSKTSKIS